MKNNTSKNNREFQSTQPKVRFQRAKRQQIEWKPLSLDQMVPEDDTVRLVWAYVEGLDLSALYAQIKAVEGNAGRDPIDPKILLALWLYATVDSIYSARRLDKLCKKHFSYTWLCGDVGVNYHTLADFRVQHGDILDDLLTQSVATLLHQGLIELNRVAQDGMRVKASAGSGSFRRKPTLEECLKTAEEHLEELNKEAEEDAAGEDRRTKAAKERAARERVERIKAALEEREKLAEKKEQRKKGTGDEARASTTDAEARKMKMANGGFNPAFNVQFATATNTYVILGTDVTNQGTDGGLIGPMYDQLGERYGQLPEDYLTDHGFAQADDVTKLEAAGTKVYMPVKGAHKMIKAGKDPYLPKKSDNKEMAQWRQRMGTDEAKEIYKQRTATAEFPNACCRNHGLRQFNVRGLLKVKSVALLHAFAHNFQRTLDLRKQHGLALV